MTSVTINGNTYSDDGTSAGDMLNGGHRTHFMPLVADVVTVAAQVAADKAAADADAASAAAVAGAMRGTSTTSLTVGTGSMSLTTQASKQFSVGNYMTIARTAAPTTLMHGVVTAYNSGTGALTVDVGVSAGSGTYTDWTLAVSGATGATGATGNGAIPYLGKAAGYTIVAGDRASLVDFTGAGGYTVAFQAAATLGANWACIVRNSTTGNLTLDPNAAETIDGAATATMLPGSIAWVDCDGSNLRLFALTPNKLMRRPILQANTGWTPASSGETITSGPYSTGLTSNYLNTFAYGSSLFVASSSASSGSVASSSDAQTWTLRTMPSSAVWILGSDGTNFLAVVNAATTVAKSADGITWSSATALGAGVSGVQQPIKVGGLWIVGGTSSTTYYTSTDGTTWTSRTFPATPSALRLVGSTAWIRTGSTTAYTSTDAINWTVRTLPQNYVSIGAQSDGALVGYLNAGTAFDRTTDGITWSATSVAPLGGLAYPPALLNGVYVASLGANWRAAVWDSAWTLRGDHLSALLDASQQVSQYACGYCGVLNSKGLGYLSSTSAYGYLALVAPSSTLTAPFTA